jgi:alanyl-tRNA synthetase
MNENIEMIEYIYKSSEMGVISCTKLLNELNNKENRIKKLISEELKKYENYLKETEKIIKKSKYEIKKASIMAKIGADIGIVKEVLMDNSDSRISNMLIQGFTMGITDIKSKISKYRKIVDKKVLKLALSYLKFQEEEVKKLSKYL